MHAAADVIACAAGSRRGREPTGRVPAPRQKQGAGPAGGHGNGADTAPRCERSLSAECERPSPGPRRACCGRHAGAWLDAELTHAFGNERERPIVGEGRSGPSGREGGAVRQRPNRARDRSVGRWGPRVLSPIVPGLGKPDRRALSVRLTRSELPVCRPFAEIGRRRSNPGPSA